MPNELAQNILKQKYGKDVTNVTGKTYNKEDVSRNEKEQLNLLKHIKKLRKSKDVPQKIINKHLKELLKKSKKYKDD